MYLKVLSPTKFTVADVHPKDSKQTADNRAHKSANQILAENPTLAL